MAGTLYLVPTPIGNLGDISQRMAQTLEEVDFIAAEDTRVSMKLLNHLGIRKPLLSYHRHNTESGGQQVLDRLLAGENCALVTDAGMPAISDPGEELVAQCAQLDIPVVPIPGPCALVTALAVSGLPTGRFTFEGFLAMNKKNRRDYPGGFCFWLTGRSNALRCRRRCLPRSSSGWPHGWDTRRFRPTRRPCCT